jgi:hypothetical protein
MPKRVMLSLSCLSDDGPCEARNFVHVFCPPGRPWCHGRARPVRVVRLERSENRPERLRCQGPFESGVPGPRRARAVIISSTGSISLGWSGSSATGTRGHLRGRSGRVEAVMVIDGEDRFDVSIGDSGEDLRRKFRAWGLRFYAGAFVTLGLLAVARAVRHDATLRIAFKVLAGSAGAISVAMGVYSSSCHVRWRRYRRSQGLPWR